MSQRLAAGLLALAIGAVPASAQVNGHFDLGLGSLSVPGIGMTTLVAVSPEVSWSPGSFRLAGGGDFRDRGLAGHDVSGAASASYFIRLPASFVVDLNAGGSFRDVAGFSTVSDYRGGVRLHWLGSATGGWLGLISGRDRFGARAGWEAGLWRSLGAISIQLQGRQLSSAAVLDQPPLATGDSAWVDSSAKTRVRLTTELGGWLSYSKGRLDLRSGAGWRVEHREPASSGTQIGVTTGLSSRSTSGWWTAEGTYWLSDRLGLTGSAGRMAPNPSLLISASNYLRLSVRISLDRRTTPLVPRPAAARGFSADRRGKAVTLVIGGAAARRVELLSDLTDWQPVDLAPGRDGRWSITLPAAAGIHYINVRYDGGEWQTPPTLSATRDEFGKETGVLLLQ